MTQAQSLSILKTGANVFLTGEPGAGKTYVINEYVRYLKECGIEPSITASTGIAATHIHGMTIHAWSGVGIKKNLTSYDIDRIATNEYTAKRILKAKVLVIDEISMLSAQMLTDVDAVCREVRQNAHPFGGLQIILVGDFFQLPPISENNDEADFAFRSPVWKNLQLITCYLTEQHRQEDSTFLEILSAIRKNAFTDGHSETLGSRMIDVDDYPVHATKLFSHNTNVDKINDEELKKLEGEAFEFPMTESGSEALCASLKRGCLSPEKLILKEGAIVMCTKNNPREGFANGTIGEVVGFDDYAKYPIIRTTHNDTITVEPMDWVIEDNGKIKAKITQVPLRLAWAITIHKSQGMSLDSAVIDLSSAFEYGQGYVALSRVRNLDGLHLLGLNGRALLVHPDVSKIDSTFHKQSRDAEEAFGEISTTELEKMHEQFITAIGGKPNKEKDKKRPATDKKFSVDELRKTHAKAYAKWTPEEDALLTELFHIGEKIPNLMQKFGRKRGAIEARLGKLGLTEDIYHKRNTKNKSS